MPKTFPIPTDNSTSAGVEATKTLGVRAKFKNLSSPSKSAPGNGNTKIGGKAQAGGARIRGGRA